MENDRKIIDEWLILRGYIFQNVSYLNEMFPV